MTTSGAQRKPPKVSGLLETGLLSVPSSAERKNMPNLSPSPRQFVQKLYLPLGKLRASPHNIRKIRTPERIEEVAASLKEDGQKEAISVYPGTGSDAGYFMIVSGVTRQMAATLLGWQEIEASIDESIDPDDPLSIVRASHIHNNTLPECDLDHAFTAKQLQEAGFSLLQVASAMGFKGNRQILRFNTFFALPESILEIGKTAPQKFTAHVAETIAKAVPILGEECALDILTNAIHRNLSLTEIGRQIDLASRKQNGKRKRSTRTQTIEFKAGGEKLGAMHVLQSVSGQKQIKLDATLPLEAADILAEKLHDLLQEFGAKLGGKKANVS